MRRARYFLISAFLFSGCFSGEQPRVHNISAVRPDRVIVYFYRPAKDNLALRGYDIYEGGSEVAKLSNGTCCFVYVNPGEHKVALAGHFERYTSVNSRVQRLHQQYRRTKRA